VSTLNSTIVAAGSAPTADVGGPYEGIAGDPVVLSGGGSRSEAENIVAYDWDFNGDGVYDATTTDALVAHTYAGPGTYDVVLRARTASGLAGTATTTVSVATAPAAAGKPENLVATPGDQQVTLTWQAGGGGIAQWYTITDGSGNLVDRVAAQPDGSPPPGWVDPSLANGTTYTYYVSAGNVSGESAPAGPVSATPRAPLRPVTFTVAGDAGASALYATGTPNGPGTEGTVFGVVRGRPLLPTSITAAGIATIGGADVLVVQFHGSDGPVELRFMKGPFPPLGTLEICGPAGCESGIGVQFDAAGVPAGGFVAPPGGGTTTTTVSSTTTPPNVTTTTAQPTSSTIPTTVARVGSPCTALQQRARGATDPVVRDQLLLAIRSLGCP
jgi:hypothetical protein